MLNYDPLSRHAPRMLRGTFAFISSADAAPQRNITQELTQTLAGEQQTAAGFLGLNEKYQPAYTRLGVDTLGTQMRGYTDDQGNYHAGTTALGQEATSSNRASSVNDLFKFGPAGTMGLLTANPFLGQSTADTSSLLAKLSASAGGLDMTGKLSPEEAYAADQETQAKMASLGTGHGNTALISSVLNRDALTRQRADANRAAVAAAAGANMQGSQTFNSTVTSPLFAMLGFPSLVPGQNGSSSSTAGAVDTANSLFPTQNAYQSDLFSSNQNAIASNNIANANNSTAMAGAGLGLLASIFSDRRLKKNIKKVGRSASGIPIMRWLYKTDPEELEYVGAMADDVEKVRPDAVRTDPVSKLKSVDYSKIDVPFGLAGTLLTA